MTKKEAYNIINNWLETDNQYRRKEYAYHNGFEYFSLTLSLYYHILRGMLKGSWKRLKWPDRRKTAGEIVIIDEYTKEHPHYWTFKVNNARYARSGGMAWAMSGVLDYLIIKNSGSIYLSWTLGESFTEQIDQYLTEGIPEREWDVTPEYVQVENY